MKTRVLVFLFFLAFANSVAFAQISATIKTTSELVLIKNNIMALADTSMHGRGYVKNGKETASKYIQKKFRDNKVKGFGKDGSYVQGYAFPVNTFPGEISLKINKTELEPGEDYIIEPGSASFNGDQMDIENLDLKQVVDTASWVEIMNALKPETAYYIDEIETVCNALNIKKNRFAYYLPKGVFIVKEKDKLIWSVNKDNCLATVFYIKETSVPKKMKTLEATVSAEFIPRSRSENLIGYVPGSGTIKDTFIAFSAHYDHLGMMGENTIFPGASDNASGTAMLLYLASYFTAHPQKYPVLFIAFSGEEADLMGSKFYSMHPVVPFKNIKFLTNIDIMGDATDGITVVNATEFPKEFGTLVDINKKNKYLPLIKPRGKTMNSDHAVFTEAGVPSFFIYSNGGKGFYHDIYDKGNELSLNHIDGVAHLIIDFVKTIN